MHPIRIRGKSKVGFLIDFIILKEPHIIKAALNHHEWKKAMDEELQALQTNST